MVRRRKPQDVGIAGQGRVDGSALLTALEIRYRHGSLGDGGDPWGGAGAGVGLGYRGSGSGGGEVADLANAGWSAAVGDFLNAGLSASGPRRAGNAELRNWRILPRIRSCATRAADLVAAVQALA